jgi:hypothetical protein
MESSDLAGSMLDALIRSHVGRGARMRRYTSELPTPMNAVLNNVRDHVPADVVIYWVDGGLPELFSEPYFSPPALVFNSRYIEITGFMRQMLEFDGEAVLGELSERVCLKLMAELALRYGDPATAAYLVTRSVLGQSVFIATGSTLLELESLDRNERYMALWFFGMLHELGHVAVSAGTSTLAAGVPQAHLRAQLAAAINELDSDHLDERSEVDFDHFSDEVAADVFAVSALISSTQAVMLTELARDIRPLRFAHEVASSFFSLVTIDRCRRALLSGP